MKRLLAICVLWSSAALTIAHAVPARPLYEPEPAPKPPAIKVDNLAGTAWLGKYGTLNRTYILEADGSVSYSSTGKTVFKMRGS